MHAISMWMAESERKVFKGRRIHVFYNYNRQAELKITGWASTCSKLVPECWKPIQRVGVTNEVTIQGEPQDAEVDRQDRK